MAGEDMAEGYGWMDMSGRKLQEWKGDELEVHARTGDPRNQRVRERAMRLQWFGRGVLGGRTGGMRTSLFGTLRALNIGFSCFISLNPRKGV